jgi:hypothetical protein
MPEPITFGAVMQGLGALTSVAGGVLGFGQAAKQKAAQQRAERESNRLMQQARRNLQTKFYEQLQVPTEAYDRQFKESTAQQQQSLQALRESDPRTLAAGVGKVGAVGVAENQKIREDMAERLFQLQKLKADEMSAINDQLVSLDVGEAMSQDIRAREARQFATAATGQGFQSLASGFSKAAESIPLFFKNKIDRKLGKITGEDLKPGSRFYEDQIQYRNEKANMDLRDSYTPSEIFDPVIPPDQAMQINEFLLNPTIAIPGSQKGVYYPSVVAPRKTQ